MRSTEWLEANEVEISGYVRLAFDELEVDDDGWVRSISSCPVIQPGDGCVVTGTFTRLNHDVASNHTYLVSDSAILSHNSCDGTKTPHTVSESRPPNGGKTGEPNSIYEQKRPDGSRSGILTNRGGGSHEKITGRYASTGR